MDIKEYVRLLKPLFKRSGLTDALDRTSDEINNTVLPYYVTTASFMTTGSSPLWKLADKQLFKQLTKVKSGSWIENVHLALLNIRTLIPELNKRIQRNINNDVATDGLSFKEANLVQMADNFSFYANYARTLLRAIVIVENGGEKALYSFFTKADIAWLTAGMNGFAIATEVLCGRTQDLLNNLDKIPDVMVNDEDGIGVGLYNAGNTDPMHQRNWQATNNPIHRIRIWFADRDEANLQAAKEEAQALEYHILALKQKQGDGTEDPRLQQQIEYHENRLKKMRYDIKRREEADD